MANNSNTQNQNNNLNMQKGDMNNSARRSSPSFVFDQNRYRNNQNNRSIQSVQNQIKRTAITEGIKKGAQTYGVPEEVTEKVLETETGKEIIDAASSSSSVNEASSAVVSVITKQTLMKYLPAIFVPLFLLLIIIVFVAGKDAFSGLGTSTDIYGDLREEISKVKIKYKNRVEIDGNLILATLVTYNDYGNLDPSENIEYMKKQVDKLATYQIMTTQSCDYDSSTIRKIASNDDMFEDTNFNCDPSVSEVNYTLSIEEGDFDDDNSGSTFYWNLIDENFIFNYYNEYMINPHQNTSENEDKINEIISEIYLYYDVMDKLNFDNYHYLCNTEGITIDGVTMNFEDYIKGVVYAETKEFVGQIPLEVLKAIAVYARSEAISYTNNCVIEMKNSHNTQLYEKGHEVDPLISIAVDETAGEYLFDNNQAVDPNYFLFPGKDLDTENVTCDYGYCTATLYYDRDEALGTYTITIEENFANRNIVDLLSTLPEQDYGMSILNLWNIYENASNIDDVSYDKLIRASLPLGSTVEISKMGSEGLVAVGGGYLMRVSRPTRDNDFYYTPDGSAGASYTLEGECAWYATGRAKEIVSTLDSDVTWNYNGNGGTYCDSVNWDMYNFEVSYDYTKPKPGAIISWKSGPYGHVAVVESVQGNTVTISEAGLGFGPYWMHGCSNGECVRNKVDLNSYNRKNYCEYDGSGCFKITTKSVQQLKNYGGAFQCYIYLTEPK